MGLTLAAGHPVARPPPFTYPPKTTAGGRPPTSPMKKTELISAATAGVIQATIENYLEYAYDDEGRAYHPWPPELADIIVQALKSAGYEVVRAT